MADVEGETLQHGKASAQMGGSSKLAHDVGKKAQLFYRPVDGFMQDKR